MQLSQTLSSALAQIKVSNSPITNHTNQFLYNLKIHFLQIVLMGEGFPALFWPFVAVVV